MPKKISVSAVKSFAKSQSCRQVIVLAWDGDLTHIVTYGTSMADCAQAAEVGNNMKKFLGWPESTQIEPSRVKKLVDENKNLRKQLSELRSDDAQR